MPAAAPSGPLPAACHVMAKPVGPACNLRCRYCFYLEKERLFRDRSGPGRMDDEVLERYVRQYLEAHDAPVVEFAWQGGEPTLAGLDFFRRAVALQERYGAGRRITNALQTNGVLLDEEWAEFLAAHRFLVGVSVDGPRELHDRYRIDRGGQPTFDRVLASLRLLRRHGVEFNTLTAVQRHNAGHPSEVYAFLREEGSGYLQLIPILERRAVAPGPDDLSLIGPEHDRPSEVTGWSVGAAEYGRFLCRIFDEWVRADVGRVFVQPFDVALGAWLGQPSSLCVFAETCGRALVLEHNGDLYACDHYVYPEYRLGNLREQFLGELVSGPELQRFGLDKRDRLPTVCRQCRYRFACNGGCPKHRFRRAPDGESGLNYLCAGYRSFFAHIDPYMQVMAAAINQGRTAAGVIPWARQLDEQAAARRRGPPGRNDPCPCGSGRKHKQCCGAAIRRGQPV
ncbi:MAG: anaerobic sulfatase maturase [Candidatus Latescibacterota bacterium]|jgi:uncharacterized protein